VIRILYGFWAARFYVLNTESRLSPCWEPGGCLRSIHKSVRSCR
jgi:hypothetical protein